MPSLSSLIVSQQPIATGAMAEYDYDEQLAKRFRCVDRFDNPYIMYKSGNGKLWLPRAVCPMGKEDRRVTGRDIDFDLLYEPRNSEQDRGIVEAYEFLSQGQSGIVEAPTGAGKTYMACALTAIMRLPTLAIVTKDDLFEQWIEAAHKFLGLPYDQIGRIRQNTCNPAGKPFTVGMIHSLSNEGKYPNWIRKAFGLVHFDEVHRLPADEFSKVAGMFSAKYRVGWSATTDRADGKEVVFQAHIGPVRVVLKGVPMVPKVFRYRTKWKVPRVPRTKDGVKKIVPLPHQAGKIAHVVKLLADDNPRNRLIAQLGQMLYEDDRHLVIFSDQRAHLETLYEYLVSLGVKSKDIAYYVGGLKKHEKEAAKTRKVLLATYNFMGEGSDIPSLDACIMASPRSDVRQIVGRVLRLKEGKPQPIVIDIIDDDSPVFSAYADKRLRYYRSVKAEVQNVS